jgi:hypothetical protein
MLEDFTGVTDHGHRWVCLSEVRRTIGRAADEAAAQSSVAARYLPTGVRVRCDLRTLILIFRPTDAPASCTLMFFTVVYEMYSITSPTYYLDVCIIAWVPVH